MLLPYLARDDGIRCVELRDVHVHIDVYTTSINGAKSNKAFADVYDLADHAVIPAISQVSQSFPVHSFAS